MELMTETQLDDLRKGYAKVDTIDPLREAYPQLIHLLDNSTQERLKQLAGANIKFVSCLARNRIKDK